MYAVPLMSNCGPQFPFLTSKMKKTSGLGQQVLVTIQRIIRFGNYFDNQTLKRLVFRRIYRLSLSFFIIYYYSRKNNR